MILKIIKMSRQVRRLKRLDAKVTKLIHELSTSKAKLKDIIHEMSGDFELAGIKLESLEITTFVEEKEHKQISDNVKYIQNINDHWFNLFDPSELVNEISPDSEVIVEEEAPVTAAAESDTPVEEEAPVTAAAESDTPVEEEAPVTAAAESDTPVEEEAPVTTAAESDTPVEDIIVTTKPSKTKSHYVSQPMDLDNMEDGNLFGTILGIVANKITYVHAGMRVHPVPFEGWHTVGNEVVLV
jgi:hypothetical protein